MSRFNDLSRMCRKLQLLAKPGLCAVAAAVALACLVPVAHAQAQASGEHEVRDIRSLNATEKKQLLEQIRARLRQVFDSAKPFPGQVAFVPHKLEFRTEARNEVLVIDLGPMDGPQLRDADMSELSAQLDGTIADFLHELGISYPIFKHEFDGRDWYYYHPEDKQYQLEYERRMHLKGKQSAIPPQDAKVAISAMHGWYWRVFEQAWALQRPTESNGIVEDYITPEFVDPLKTHLFARSNVLLVGLPRSQSTDIHPDSGYPWWQMAGRYYLKEQYPDNPEIWHSLDRPTSPRRRNLWQYDEDIRSRPLFASHIGADVLFSLHTNAGPPTASGTRAYVAPGRAEDLALANNVLCGMKELIHAQDAYQDFEVDDQVREDDGYGENNLATMPAVVLEVAFHTNAGDAAALQDPVFVDAAMKGVEKGYRLQAEGEVCVPFKIASIPDVTVPRPGAMDVPVNYEGFPYFPVTLTIENLVCPPNNTCTGGTITYTEQQDSPLYFPFSCGGASDTVDVSRWRSTLVDTDGVESDPVEHELTCLPTPGNAANGKPSVSIGSA